MAEKTALPVPRAVETATDAHEVLSVWIIDQQELASVFPPDLYGEDIWKWGRLLANVARYAANAHAKIHGLPEADALDAIRVNFDEEIRRGAPPGGVLLGAQ